MIAKEMIAEKVFAEGVAKDIRNFLPAKYENAEFQVMQMNTQYQQATPLDCHTGFLSGSLRQLVRGIPETLRK